jgi:hypothetical protein
LESEIQSAKKVKKDIDRYDGFVEKYTWRGMYLQSISFVKEYIIKLITGQ